MFNINMNKFLKELEQKYDIKILENFTYRGINNFKVIEKGETEPFWIEIKSFESPALAFKRIFGNL